jgi:peptidoglycan biosynthesis protein MviN/MurJ (putative lipid II flippase)
MALTEPQSSFLLRVASLLSLLNVSWLGYIAWQRSHAGGCPLCHLVPFLPVTDVGVAVAGMIASAVLAVLCYFVVAKKGLRYPTLLFAALCTAFASFLQLSNLHVTGSFCPQCLVASIGFYLVFGLLLYEIIIKSLFLPTAGGCEERARS